MPWIDNFPGLSRLPEPLREMLLTHARVAALPEGTVLFGPGKAPEHLVLLLSGVVRVQQVGENGREIVLYRVHAFESCVLTTACLLAYDDYQAEGVAETAIEAVLIPKAVFEEMIAGSADFRRFVFAAYSKRITDLFTVIDEIAFKRLDLRLAAKLTALSGGGSGMSAGSDAWEGVETDLKITHAQLATELGTAREVVSRQLQEFQRRGWIENHRGGMRIRDAEALAVFARS